MIKELKFFFYILIIFLSIFFTLKYYFSDNNKKKSYRSLNINNQKIINFAKKLVDDLNLTKYLGSKKFKYSLNKYIYSIQFFEGFALFKVNKELCTDNMLLDNDAERANHWDYRYGKESKLVYLKKIHIIRKLVTKIIFLKNIFHNKLQTSKIKKYFK